jgi:hypothetical protein
MNLNFKLLEGKFIIWQKALPATICLLHKEESLSVRLFIWW